MSLALERFTNNLKQSLKVNVDRDNRGELHKIFTVYQQLDKLDEGVQEYLNTVIRQFMVQFELLDKAPPSHQNLRTSSLPELEQFFQSKFIPSAVEMINNEVKVGVPSGRMIDIIGPEHRFMMSRLLINKFLDEYNRLIQGYLKHDFGTEYLLKLQVIKLVIQATRHLFFFKLSPVLQA